MPEKSTHVKRHSKCLLISFSMISSVWTKYYILISEVNALRYYVCVHFRSTHTDIDLSSFNNVSLILFYLHYKKELIFQSQSS